jgi:hypothetical protein
MSTKLEALVNVLKANGVEEAKLIEQLIVENFTSQSETEYDINGVTYVVLTQIEIDEFLYDIAEDNAYDTQFEMEEIFTRHRNFEMIEMLETMDHSKCIDIILRNYDENTLGEKQHMAFILEEDGYFIYLKD